MEQAASAPPTSTAALTPHRQILEIDLGIDVVIQALELKSHADDPAGPPSRESQLLNELNQQLLRGETPNLAGAMKQFGLILPEMLDLVHQRNTALAIASSSRHTAEVLDGIGEFSKPRWTICDTCSGEGEVEDRDGSSVGGGLNSSSDLGEDELLPLKKCPNPECRNGKVRRMGNLDAAKLFLDVQGMRKGPGGDGRGGTTINVAAQAGVKVGALGGSDDNRKPQQEVVTVRVQKMLEG